LCICLVVHMSDRPDTFSTIFEIVVSGWSGHMHNHFLFLLLNVWMYIWCVLHKQEQHAIGLLVQHAICPLTVLMYVQTKIQYDATHIKKHVDEIHIIRNTRLMDGTPHTYSFFWLYQTRLRFFFCFLHVFPFWLDVYLVVN
jgi:hypothetical protein